MSIEDVMKFKGEVHPREMEKLIEDLYEFLSNANPQDDSYQGNYLQKVNDIKTGINMMKRGIKRGSIPKDFEDSITQYEKDLRIAEYAWKANDRRSAA